MDSEEQRYAAVHSEKYSDKPYGHHPRKDGLYENKRAPFKGQLRTDPKKADADKKKKKKREDAPPEKEETEIILPPKREKKGFQLILQDGSELTSQIILEEFKKHQILVDAPATEVSAKEKEASSETQASSEEVSQKKILEEAAPEKKVPEEKIPEEKAPVQMSDMEAIRLQIQKQMEEREKNSLLEKAATQKESQQEKTTVTEKAEKQQEQTIIKSAPVKTPSESENKSVPKEVIISTEELQRSINLKSGDSVWNNTGHTDQMRKNIFSGLAKAITKPSSAPKTAKKTPVAPVETPTEKTRTGRRDARPETEPQRTTGRTKAPVEAEVKETVKPEFIKQKTTRTEVASPKTEVSSPKTETPKAEAVIKTEASPKTEEKEPAGVEINAPLPIIYGKEFLWSLQAVGESVPCSLDKALLARTLGSARRKKEFKTFRAGSGFKETRKNALPVTVFDKIETYVAEFNLSLNQVCQNNIEAVAQRILSIKVPNEEAMVALGTAFFNRAMQEQAYTSVYAALLERLEKTFRAATEDPKAKGIFRQTVIHLAKEDFLAPRTWASDETESGPQRLTADELSKRVLEISSNKDKEYARMGVKKRALTITRFAVEMYMQQVLNDAAMHSSVHAIIQERTPENLEKVCYILKHAGVRLDVPAGREYVDIYISWLKETAAGLSIRYKFLVEDIVALRAHGWTEKAQAEEDDGWRSSKTKEKKKYTQTFKKDGPQKPLKVAEYIDAHMDECRDMETATVSTLKRRDRPFPTGEEARRLSVEYSGVSAVFLAVLVKITIEGYGEVLENGLGLLREWTRVTQPTEQKREEVIEYIEEIMPDLMDDSPKAPEHFEAVKKILQK
ncbi:uncharacterized protein NESG_02084 [Nematocida ausubeli]|uniref:MIF4G domain-containing protein n=1 Tax=Nematocida ausubeli (strain ATCC PRA-371 / ERTm2) TaxID=1913371 RepID=A0A086IZJ5_NEMA1|nr:uncharacterized protein NESG_02084 [Nematocida ausubeli]KFG25313.1 hypothetical protein NESG_02084 [Nematocida ausubeli]